MEIVIGSGIWAIICTVWLLIVLNVIDVGISKRYILKFCISIGMLIVSVLRLFETLVG